MSLSYVVTAQVFGLVVRICSQRVLSASVLCMVSACFLCAACALSLVVSSRLDLQMYVHDFALGTC
jgi:hypothetical protein